MNKIIKLTVENVSEENFQELYYGGTIEVEE